MNKDDNRGIWIKLESEKFINGEYGDSYYTIREHISTKTNWDDYLDRSLTYGAEFKENIYFYFTKDESGEYTVPKIEICTQRDKENNEFVTIINGIEEENIVEDSLINVLDEQLKKFSDYYKYEKKINDMRILSQIKDKHTRGDDLTNEEIIFLYGINYYVENACSYRIPWINKIKKERNIKKDFSILLGCDVKNIGIKIEDFYENEILIYIGNLIDKQIIDKTRLKWLKYIFGDVYFNNCCDVSELSNLEYIYGDARFDKLKNAEGLKNLKYISKSLYLSNADVYQDMQSLELVGGYIEIHALDKRENKRLVKGIYKK